MPNVRQADGRSREIASAVNDKTLKMIQDAVIAEYEKRIRSTTKALEVNMVTYLSRRYRAVTAISALSCVSLDETHRFK